MNRKKIFTAMLLLIFSISMASALPGFMEKPLDEKQKTTIASQVVLTLDPVYTLQPGEEYVYGKVGLKDDGSIKYTVAIVRKPNDTKQIYESNFDPYTSRPVGEPVMKLNNNPKAYEKYDFWLIFNGEKHGPYDRILDMTQDDPDIDNWVSRDGKAISFVGVKGQRYYPVINNQGYIPFWTTGQAPDYDRLSGRTTNAFQYSQGDFRLYENGPKVLEGWKNISKVTYSENGSGLLYVGAPENRNEKYVYVNHQKVAGPYYLVSKVGFIPGTDKIYCAGFDIHTNYHEVILGDKRIPVPDGTSVTNWNVNENRIVFTMETRVAEMEPEYHALARRFIVYEYDIESGTLNTHGEYWKTLNVREFNGDFYYETVSKDEEFLYLSQGGKVLMKKKVEDGPEFILYTRDVVTPDGTLYLAYRNAKPNGNIRDAHQFAYVITKNGIKAAEYDAPFAEKGRLIESNGQPFFVFNLDQSVASVDRMFYYGGREIRSGGYVMENVCAPESLDVYSVVRTDDMRRRVYRNGNPADTQVWKGLTALAVSGNGSMYAALVSGSLETYSEYYTTSAHLDAGWKLVVNGQVRSGKYGAPVWAKAYGSMIALMQQGDKLVVDKIK